MKFSRLTDEELKTIHTSRLSSSTDLDSRFMTGFGDSWKEYRAALWSTAPWVIECFSKTKLGEQIAFHYPSSLPRNGESPINFWSRNERAAYSTESIETMKKIEVAIRLGKTLYYFGKIPFIGRLAGLNGVSTELYVGQETQGYVSHDGISQLGKELEANPQNRCKKVHATMIVSNLKRSPGIEFDVGWIKGNYFYNIVANDEEFLPQARLIYQKMKDVRR